MNYSRKISKWADKINDVVGLDKKSKQVYKFVNNIATKETNILGKKFSWLWFIMCWGFSFNFLVRTMSKLGVLVIYDIWEGFVFYVVWSFFLWLWLKILLDKVDVSIIVLLGVAIILLSEFIL